MPLSFLHLTFLPPANPFFLDNISVHLVVFEHAFCLDIFSLDHADSKRLSLFQVAAVLALRHIFASYSRLRYYGRDEFLPSVMVPAAFSLSH